ncbi:MAG: DUF63 family protein [Natronomonas sp.]
MNLPGGIDPTRAWVGTFIAGVVTLAAGAAAFPRQVYDGFLWRYFWGPVDADAHGATCAVRSDGITERLHSGAACGSAEGIVVTPGYTTVSTVSYAVVLIFMLIGVLLLLRRLGVEMNPRFYFALFPFMFLGGALRVVEDVNATLIDETGELAIAFPEVALIISPFIYFVMFVVTLAALVVAIGLEKRGIVGAYHPTLAGFGTVGVVGVVGWLLWMAVSSDAVGFFPMVTLITLGGATGITAVYWWASERYAPVINEGTGAMGILVVWGHAVDGVANVLSLDWAAALGLPVRYGPKHVVNEATIVVTQAVQPPWLSAMIGTVWPFLFIKVGAAIAVVWVFDRQIFEDSPYYGYLLFIAILAVGLGPGTRDMLRATLGI